MHELREVGCSNYSASLFHLKAHFRLIALLLIVMLLIFVLLVVRNSPRPLDLYGENLRTSRFQLLPGIPGRQYSIYKPARTLEEMVADQYGYDLETAKTSVKVFFYLGWPGIYSTIVNLKEPQLPRNAHDFDR